MDIDSPDDDTVDPRQSGDRNQDLDDIHEFDSSTGQQHHQARSESLPQSTFTAQYFSEQKWKQLQKFYKDGYAELLRAEVLETPSDGVPPLDLKQSQIGAVTWYPYEKAALYQALSRRGQRDLPFLAAAVGSKSQLEIRDYLLLLREKETERHLFHRKTKAISHADIPAAVEISAEIEEALEEAADAQLAYENHYELVAGAQKNDSLWRIDSEIAERLDEEQDKIEEAREDRSEPTDEATFEPPIFHISTFVELSERLFMNNGGSKSHENWRDIAMEGETPALTQEVISELYDMAVNFTRRLMQTSLFLAQSRQRTTTSNHYRHRAMVREQDVAAAINVLGLTCDLWDFWVSVPRRNSLDVVDEKRKGNGRKTKMPYEAVEQILSRRKARWRGRRRSYSAGSGNSMTEDEAFDTADQMSEGDDAGSDSSASEHVMSSDDDNSNIPEAHPLDAILDASSSNEVQDESSWHLSSADSSPETPSDDLGGFDFQTATPRQKHRQTYLEYQQDDCLEEIDAEASREEETRLWENLGREPPMSIKSKEGEKTNPPIRLRVLRKLTNDLKDPVEACEYGAAWELFGAEVPNDSFVGTERARKRVKMMPREISTIGASKKSHLPFRTRSLSTDNRDTSEIDSTDEV